MFPKISIITPSYNQGRFIEKTIKSILDQNYPNLEYIIMDGGSTDGTINILKKYGKQITWFSDKDEGPADAINKGFKKATGEILSWIGSDDILLPDSLLKVSEYFEKHNNCQWAIGRCRIIDQNGREIRKIITTYKNLWLNHYCYSTLLILNYINQPSVFFTKNAFKKIGNLKTKEYWEFDYDYWLRLGKQYQPGLINEYLASFRVHKDTRTQLDPKHFIEEIGTARRYTRNPIIILLHYLNYFTILLGYSLIFKIK